LELKRGRDLNNVEQNNLNISKVGSNFTKSDSFQNVLGDLIEVNQNNSINKGLTLSNIYLDNFSIYKEIHKESVVVTGIKELLENYLIGNQINKGVGIINFETEDDFLILRVISSFQSMNITKHFSEILNSKFKFELDDAYKSEDLIQNWKMSVKELDEKRGNDFYRVMLKEYKFTGLSTDRLISYTYYDSSGMMQRMRLHEFLIRKN